MLMCRNKNIQDFKMRLTNFLCIRGPRISSRFGYSLCKLNMCDKEQVLDFLGRFFYRDEPLNQAVGLLETPELRCKELEDYTSRSLEDGVSIAAVDDEKNFIGIAINDVVRRSDKKKSVKLENIKDPKFRLIMKVLAHLETQARIWEKLPKTCQAVVEIKMVSIHSDWRGRGLMKVLCKKSEKIAKSIDACAMIMDATSAFSAAAAETLLYKQVYGIPYKELSYLPQLKPPHTEARVYMKKL